jgi:hypothetical protein
MVMIRVHEAEQVAGIIDEAQRLADESEREGAQWLAVFEQSCALLGARVPFIPPQPQAMNLPDLRFNGGKA